MPSVKGSSGHVAQKESIGFCHASKAQLVVQLAEKMVALNVDYSAWIVTDLGVI